MSAKTKAAGPASARSTARRDSAAVHRDSSAAGPTTKRRATTAAAGAGSDAMSGPKGSGKRKA